jgi:STAM-binding protein
MRPIDMPAELLDRFLGVARLNTLRKVETCGLLLGKERGAGFTIVTLLIPEQRGTQDTCTMESEELVVEFSTDRDLLTLGWVSIPWFVMGHRTDLSE